MEQVEEAAGLLKDASLDDWLSDIYNAVEEGMALTGAINVDLVGVRFGATLASQCDHDRIRHYLFWDPIDTGEEYLHWLDCVNKFTHNNIYSCSICIFKIFHMTVSS